MALAPTPENFRAELARHALSRKCVAEYIGMHPSLLSGFVAGSVPLKGWAAHNIGVGINALTGLRLLDVNDAEGLRPPPPRGRPKGWNNPGSVDPTRKPASEWRRYRRTG